MKYAPQMVGIVISQYPRAPHILSVNRSDACSWPLCGYVRAFIKRSRWPAEIKDLHFKTGRPYAVEVHNQR